MGRLEFFRSGNVSWQQGVIRLQRATWHSCMQWGWPSLRRGEHLIEWFHYWVLSIRLGRFGWCLHWYPYLPSYRRVTEIRSASPTTPQED